MKKIEWIEKHANQLKNNGGMAVTLFLMIIIKKCFVTVAPLETFFFCFFLPPNIFSPFFSPNSRVIWRWQVTRNVILVLSRVVLILSRVVRVIFCENEYFSEISNNI